MRTNLDLEGHHAFPWCRSWQAFDSGAELPKSCPSGFAGSQSLSSAYLKRPESTRSPKAIEPDSGLQDHTDDQEPPTRDNGRGYQTIIHQELSSNHLENRRCRLPVQSAGQCRAFSEADSDAISPKARLHDPMRFAIPYERLHDHTCQTESPSN